MANGSWVDWKDRIAWILLVGLVSGATLWGGWVTISLFERPTSGQMVEHIRTSAPYVEDREYVRRSLDRMRAAEERILGMVEKNHARLSGVIEKNSEAIHALAIELAKIRTALEDK